MNKLTARDKALIAIGVLVLIMLLWFFFMIKPMISAKQDNATKIEELNFQKEQLEVKLATYDSVLKKNEADKELIAKAKERFHEMKTSWDSERWVTQIMTMNGVNVEATNVTDPQPYVYKTTTETTNEDGTKNVVETTVTSPTIYFETATMTFELPYKNFEDFVSLMNNFATVSKTTALTSWSYALAEQKDAPDTIVNVDEDIPIEGVVPETAKKGEIVMSGSFNVTQYMMAVQAEESPALS